MKELKFSDAFSYPFHRAKGLTNIFLILIPIVGPFVLSGYIIRIVKEFIQGKFKELPKLDFGNDLTLGFMMFLKSIPFSLAYMIPMFILISISDWFNILQYFLSLFILPILYVNFMKKETVKSLFEFKVLKPVFQNFGEYLIVVLNSIALSLIFLIMCIVLVGFPALEFTGNIFYADFYRRKIKS